MDSSSTRLRTGSGTRPRPVRVLVLVVAAVLALVSVAIAGTSAYFLVATHSRIVSDWPAPAEDSDVQLAPERSSKASRRAEDLRLFKEREMAADSISRSMESDPQCIVVLGARAYEDSRPSPALARRLQRSLELYDAGAAPAICITGDGRPDSEPETKAMRQWLLARGVHEDDLIVDSAGYTTFISMRNLARMGITSAIVVTQDYHLPRAIYDAEDQGIEVRGVPVQQNRMSLRIVLRESLARVKTLWIAAFS